jgi:hypothetical protein
MALGALAYVHLRRGIERSESREKKGSDPLEGSKSTKGAVANSLFKALITLANSLFKALIPTRQKICEGNIEQYR